MKFDAAFWLPVLLATLSCVTPNSSVVAQGFGRRLGLADFATNDLLRQSRASTSLEEPEQQSIEGRQLPFQPQSAPRQRQLRPMLRQPLSKGRPISKRNRPSRINSFEDESSNIVQQGWGQQGRKSVRDGARYDNNGNRIKRPASNKFPRQQVKNLLIPKQAVPKQSRPLIKVQKKKYQQYQPTKVARRGQTRPVERDSFEDQSRLSMLATPDAGQIASSSQQSFAPKRFSNSEDRYPKRNERPSFDYQRPFSGYDETPTEAPIVRRRVDPTLEAVIEDVAPNSYTRDRSSDSYGSPEDLVIEEKYPVEDYKVSSAPAFGSPSNRRDSYVESPYGYQIPPEQKDLQAAVYAGADAYGAHHSRQNEGVYQNEERLSFQIHGHDGPHSYRYGYDTGNGYNRQFRYEERDGKGQLKGRYGFFDKYGDLKVVNYSADPYAGFHAEGAGVPEYPH